MSMPHIEIIPAGRNYKVICEDVDCVDITALSPNEADRALNAHVAWHQNGSQND